MGHSAGMFDVEKLAWMNRHYMKVAAPGRIAAESIRYFLARGYVRRRTDEAMEYIARCCRWRSAPSIGSRRSRIG